MPKLKKKEEAKLKGLIYNLQHIEVDHVGELNHLITELCKAYFKKHGENYQSGNDIIGVMEEVKLEFHRLIMVIKEQESTNDEEK